MLHRLRHDQGGISMIEVVVAMAIGLIIVAAVATGLAASNNSSLAGERQVQLLSLAQKQLEAVRQAVTRYGFSDMFLNASPGSPDASVPADPTNPNDYINTATNPWSFYIEENYNNNAGNLSGNQVADVPSSGEPLLVGTATSSLPGIAPVSTSVAAGGGGTATVYTYITEVADACNTALASATSSLGSSSCSSTQASEDVRRVVVAVVYNSTSSQPQTPNYPQYATTIISNPTPSNQVNASNGLHLGLNIGGSVGVGS